VEIVKASDDARIAMPSWWETHALQTYYGVPIVGDEGALLGILALYGRERLHFSAGDRDLLDSFVALAAVAVRNASLYEAETMARQLAEQANRSKSEFLSRMSHELRTPLNAILGFAQILELARLQSRDAEAVGHILTAGKHLLGLIDEVLDIERIETGHLAITIESVPVHELLGGLSDLVQTMAASRSITLDLRGLDGVIVQADRQQLRQVLLNLLTNAVKYNREGGSVTVACEQRESGQVRINVRDTGPGISAARMSYLFNPFDRLGAEKSGVQGTGLGLTIARTLTEAMGGQLGVESVVGHGTTFWVQLEGTVSTAPPVTAAIEPPVELAEHAATRRRHILYVGHDRPSAQLAERTLAWRPQVRLLTAETGEEGVQLARRQQPLLILVDPHISGMTGAELLMQLQADAGTAEIPVVVLSADTDREQIEQLVAAGARTHLRKPLDVRAFLGIVDEILLEAS
jgi:signal transduction histidine kinase